LFSVHDARDAEDNRLFQEGDLNTLLAGTSTLCASGASFASATAMPATRPRSSCSFGSSETGRLEPRGVDARVWDAIADALKARVSVLAGWRPPPAPAQAAYFRASQALFELAAEASAAAAPPPAPAEEFDEVDRLFLRGSP
jgi:hypothetical protein